MMYALKLVEIENKSTQTDQILAIENVNNFTINDIVSPANNDEDKSNSFYKIFNNIFKQDFVPMDEFVEFEKKRDFINENKLNMEYIDLYCYEKLDDFFKNDSEDEKSFLKPIKNNKRMLGKKKKRANK